MIFETQRIYKDDNDIEYICDCALIMSEIIKIESFTEDFFSINNGLSTIYLREGGNIIVISEYKTVLRHWKKYLDKQLMYVSN